MKMKFTIGLSICAFLLSVTKANSQDCNCMVDLDSTFTLVEFNGADPLDGFRNDDLSSLAIALPFSFNLYGSNYDTCFINNNGNVSFLNSYYTFTASGFPVADYPMVAAFWADVDTRNAMSGLVYYKITEHELIVRWNAVGYFSNMADKLNDFQLVISDGTTNLIPDGNNISFCYGDMQWTTGSASGGSEGFDGSPANIGANAGDGLNAMQIGLFNTAGNAYDGPLDNYDGVDFLDYSHLYFSTNPLDANQNPIGVSNYCDTIIGYPGDSIAFFFYDFDATQNLSFTLDTDWGQYLSVNAATGGMVLNDGELHSNHENSDRSVLGDRVGIVHISPLTPPGYYPFYITATDDGVPALSTSKYHVLQVIEGTPNTIMDMTHNSSVNAYFQEGRLLFTGVEQNKISSIKLYDVSGKLVYAKNQEQETHMNNLENGMYMFVIESNGKVYNGKVVKN